MSILKLMQNSITWQARRLNQISKLICFTQVVGTGPLAQCLMKMVSRQRFAIDSDRQGSPKKEPHYLCGKAIASILNLVI